MRGHRSGLLALYVAAMCSAMPALAADPDTHAEMLTRAEHAIEQADLVADADPDSARRLEREAAAVYRALIEDEGLATPALLRNLGTVEFRLGNLGHAIASLRRAERLDPTDPRVRDALRAARLRVGTRPPPGRLATVDRVLAWATGTVTPEAAASIALALWTLGWSVLAVRRFAPRAAPKWAPGPSLALALLLGAFAGVAAWRDAQGDAAVVVAPGVIARRGPSEAVFEPAFEQPLTPGVEASVLESRTGWLRLRLGGGAECWVPEEAVERL